MARVVPINVMTVTEMVKRKRWEVIHGIIRRGRKFLERERERIDTAGEKSPCSHVSLSFETSVVLGAQEYIYYVYAIHPMSYAARLAMYNNAFGQSQFTIRSIKLEKRCMIDLLRRDTRAVDAQPIQSIEDRGMEDQSGERITEHGADIGQGAAEWSEGFDHRESFECMH
ncbi:hypothetical protein OIU85_006456 [Salix viminalis]|uniref:Uncharacterized protein n=1 Tax=Salix viminalis TaxID=40686 RepID=A0A9Q0PL83_SALVM|nr:hypothetical protein OIU85_006456 [Salix viminalis]